MPVARANPVASNEQANARFNLARSTDMAVSQFHLHHVRKIRYQNNDYSAPARYGHQDVLARGYVDWVKFVCRRFYRQPLTRSKQISTFRCSSLPFLCYEQKFRPDRWSAAVP